MWRINFFVPSKHGYICFLAVTVSLILSCTTLTNPQENPLNSYKQLTPATNLDAPTPGLDSEDAVRGRYMVELLGCGTCHTDGALIGDPVDGHLLAGSQVGIAYTSPLDGNWPGVVFPSNLTPDPETGIGNWTESELILMIRHGVDRYGVQQLPVMPWPAYARMSDEDAKAIAVYLRALTPVKNKIPVKTYPGTGSASAYVHFGVYQSRD